MSKVPLDERAPEAIQGRDLVTFFAYGGEVGEVKRRKEGENAGLCVHG
jgi:hypothetical protein